MTKITLIVATDQQNGIGINNQLPWHLPEDLAHFKRTTSGHPIIMGRKTFESIGRPLPNRRNIVISRNPDWRHDGVDNFTSIQEAVEALGVDEAFVIGGAQIYQEAITFAQGIIATEIQAKFDCDAFFPAIDKQIWEVVKRQEFIAEGNHLQYAIVSYSRKDKE
ncbi:dihydrofolate reductase [Undibacterium fentianense]|uniref:Dihydrofolate reductase n=1 Tax=Undibacterium fentianense TaxID=2828728 RepID=A0A941IDV5_9BURK|nr:dihydrofolate reductase [Undibacterium fentianense]MBR7798976.1 dihydrofolate reductase [Undibacterium fentianense]